MTGAARRATRVRAARRAHFVVLASLGCLLVERSARAEEAEASDASRLRAPAARVVAIRTVELPDDPTSFTSVIDASEYRGEARSTEELLSKSVGVQVRRFGGPGQLSEISIRGSTSQQVVVLLDGVRLNTAQSGSVDLSTLPLSLLDRIEVSRGGGAVQAGSDAIGGVVNLVTRRPGKRPRAALEVSRGSFDTTRLSLSHDRRVGPWGYALGYDGFETDGDWRFQTREFRGSGGIVLSPSQELERVNNRAERHAGLLRIERSFGADAHVAATNHVQFVSRGEPGFDQGSGFLAGQRLRAHERRTRNVFDLQAEHAALVERGEGTLAGRARFFHRSERLRFRDRAAIPVIDVRDRNDSLGGRAELELAGPLAASDHRLTLATELRRDSLATRSAARGTPRRSVVGVFLQDEISLWQGRALLAPALRYDDTGGVGGEWVPRLGLVLEPLPWLRIKSNVERSYRVPNLDELFLPNKGFVRGNPNLEPEDALGVDVGLEVGLAQLAFLNDLSFEVAYFHRDVRNSIVFQAVSPSVIAATNTDDARVDGVEVAGAVGVLGWLTLSANWTHLDTEVASTGAPLPGRPDDEVSLRIALGPPSRIVRLSAERHSVSRITTNFSGRSTIEGYAVWDARLAADLAALLPVRHPVLPGELIVSVNVSNLGDRSVRDSANFPQPGRTLTFKLEGRW